MRVLMVAHSFPRTPDDVAGAFLWRLCEALVDRGHAVKVIAPADRGETGPPLLGRVEVRRVRYASPGAETLAYGGAMHAGAAKSPLAAVTFARLVLATRRAVDQECGDGSIHVVHAHWWVPGGIASAWADRHGRPLVITLHGTDVRLARTIPGAWLGMRLMLRRANVVTAVSSYLADEAARMGGIRREGIPVTPMPLLGLESAGPAVGIPHGVVFVGRLTRQKGVSYLLEALAILKKQGLPLDLTIVGDGPERVALKAQALALGVPVVFTGFVPPDQVPDQLAGKRVFVLPSIEEGLGLVVAEALAQGVPVVATRSGGIPDLLTEEGAGVLVPPADPPAMAAAIKQVVSDDSYLTEAVNAGRVLLARLSPAAAAATFEQVYAEARGRRSSGSRKRASGAGGL
jgi:glycosyltransferase involved in cell wall biosynthesis